MHRSTDGDIQHPMLETLDLISTARTPRPNPGSGQSRVPCQNRETRGSEAEIPGVANPKQSSNVQRDPSPTFLHQMRIEAKVGGK